MKKCDFYTCADYRNYKQPSTIKRRSAWTSKKYPTANTVNTKQLTNVYISVVEDQLSVRQETTEEKIFLNDHAIKAAEQSISYSTFFTLEEIEAQSVVNINGKPKTYAVKEFKEKDDLNGSFRDDNKLVSFIYPKLNKGAKTRLKYTYDIKNPRFLSPFYFGSSNPVDESKFVIEADNNVKLRFETVNAEGFDIKFTTEKGRKKTKYIWERKEIEGFDFEAFSPSYHYIFPHVVPIIESYDNKKGENTPLLNETKDLYDWYYTLTETPRKEILEDDIVAKVTELTAGLTDEKEKVEAIYEWVQQNIKYVAFEYALGGFIPRNANDIYTKKYGDCKDNTSILYKMLETAGIKGHFTWIGTRDLPYKYNDIPTPIVDNHMILTYIDKNDKPHFLDATGRFATLDHYTGFIQGKEALIGIDDNNFRIEQVPIIPAKENAIRDTTRLQLIGKDIIGHTASELKGFQKKFTFYRLDGEKDQEKQLSYFNKVFEKGNNSFLMENFQDKNRFNYHLPYEVSFDFKIPNYASSYQDELYVNLNLTNELSYLLTKKDRKNDIEYEFLTYDNYYNIFEIPEGYQVDYVPENLEIDNDHFYFATTYKKTEKEVICEYTFEMKTLMIPNKDVTSYNEDLKKASKYFNEIVVLKSTSKK